MEDYEIIELYFQRNETAINQTDAKYGKYCLSVANNILRSLQDSEECVNDTWLRAWHAMPPQRPNVLRQFLAKITRKLSLNRYNAMQAEKRGGGVVALALDELAGCVPGGTNPADETEKRALKESILRFLAAMTEREQGIFLRRYFYMEEFAVIAEKYALKEANVRLILSRTRQKLRLHLGKEDFVV